MLLNSELTSHLGINDCGNLLGDWRLVMTPITR